MALGLRLVAAEVEAAHLHAQLGQVRVASDGLRLAREELAANQRAERAEAAIERVRAECDRIEAAVHDSPTSPDLAGGYLACLRHIRAALAPQEPQPGAEA